MSSPNTPWTPYRHVDEGQGNTFTFPGPNSTTYLGTTRLITCVGVYLPIDDNRCFFAHINAFVTAPGSTNAIRLVSAVEGQQLRRLTRDKLTKHAEQNGWTAKDIGKCVAEGGGRRIVMMCPQYSKDFFGNTNSGAHVVEGIRDFLKAEGAFVDGKTYFDDPLLGGFVVNHNNGAVDVMWAGKASKLVKDETQRPSDEEWMIKFEKGAEGGR